jgi:GT2 family glycosyltransferase
MATPQDTSFGAQPALSGYGTSALKGPAVSLLLPNRNNGPVLELMLRHLSEHTTYRDVELIAVDDGSTDQSLQILRRWHRRRTFPGEMQLLERPHRGVAPALNEALAAASGDYIVSLDGDATIETPAWLERMVAFAESDDRIGAVCGTVVLDTGRVHAMGVSVVGPRGMHDRPAQITEPAGSRSLHSNVVRPAPVPGAVIAEVDASIGCYLLFRRAAAEELGGYDTGYPPVWFEDLDLTIGLRSLGQKVFYLPEIEIIHRQSLRNGRGDVRPVHLRAASAVRRRIGPAVPQPVKDRLIVAMGRDRPPEEIVSRLRDHYAHWRERWGFDPLNPDMGAVLERWGHTEICWAFDPARREAGRAIADRYAARGVAASR